MTRAMLGLSIAILALACGKDHVLSAPAAAKTLAAPLRAAAAVAATPFEGEIVITVEDKGSEKLPICITYDVKGNKVSYVPALAPVHAVADLGAQQAYAIDDLKRSYDLMDLKPRANSKAAESPRVRMTGKIEKVAGLDCEDWAIDDGNTEVDVCASKGIAYFDLARDARAGNVEPPWAVALTSGNAFPLRVVMHEKGGKERYRAEATAAERKQIDDATFQLPPGYKRANLAKETTTASLP